MCRVTNSGLPKATVFLEYLSGTLSPLIANSVTLPYYRFYRQNTLLPILAIANSVENQGSEEATFDRLRHWQDRKLAEFKFVAAAASRASSHLPNPLFRFSGAL